MTTTEETLAKLAATISAKNDPDFTSQHRFIPGDAVTDEAIDAREAELGVRFPPSYREFIRKHGRFTLGDPKVYDQLAFKVWPLAQHKIGLAEYAEQLGCDVTAEAVAGEIGMDAEVVGVMGRIVLIGVRGHEDFVGFDLRTRNETTGECDFVFMLFDDTEIEALSEKEVTPCEGRGFDAWLAKHTASE